MRNWNAGQYAQSRHRHRPHSEVAPKDSMNQRETQNQACGRNKERVPKKAFVITPRNDHSHDRRKIDEPIPNSDYGTNNPTRLIRPGCPKPT
jgi:hypothetical protein